jgi:hypothetical protein
LKSDTAGSRRWLDPGKSEALIKSDRNVYANVLVTALAYLAAVISGGIWGVLAVQIWWSIAIVAKGASAATFLMVPVLMLPWALISARLMLRLFDEWHDYLIGDL